MDKNKRKWCGDQSVLTRWRKGGWSRWSCLRFENGQVSTDAVGKGVNERGAMALALLGVTDGGGAKEDGVETVSPSGFWKTEYDRP